MATNFELAPAAKTVDGFFAVCIDIQSITGTVNFDAVTSTAQADVTIDFIMGDQDGCPVFDLRQDISEAWLDGTPIAAALLAHHDFGGGVNAELRVVEATLSANSAHSLRLLYNLSTPQASTAGSYQPGLSWNSGPRLIFNFGFTDLGAGRYLESWIPANLIFDQFEIDLTFIVENTSIDHEIISNGQVTPVSGNYWQVQWPEHTSALSTLLEIRAADSLASLSDILILPVSGGSISIDVWKLVSSSIDLSAQINLIKTFLSDNETDVGAYLHGNRFVAFFITGGMEYDGGTTTSTGPLRHETFHSWWGRGIKPASQNDGWWDEAWTVYSMAGGSSSIPFDFTRAPVVLSSLNPWNRVTPGDSYDEGKRVFDGLATLQSAASLRTAMNGFYNQNNTKPVTTRELESHLLCNIGKKEIVDGFHRFVYGFSDSVSATDLWLKDHPEHGGADGWDGVYWNSPDLWIRNADDDGTAHQNPEYGQDNWFYARVRNRSSVTAQHFVVSFTAQTYAGMQFSFPDDFLPCTAATAEFNLAAGETRIVKARWPRALVPPAGTHSCLLASVLTRGDHPATGNRVWEHNNLVQKNLTVVDLEPNVWFLLPFVFRNLERRIFPWFDLHLSRFSGAEEADVELMHPQLEAFSGFFWCVNTRGLPNRKNDIKARSNNLLDCGVDHDEEIQLNHLPWTSKNPDAAVAPLFNQSASRKFGHAHHSRLRLTLPYNEPYMFGLRIKVPAHAKPGSVLRFHLAQKLWPWRRLCGGISVEVRVKEPRIN